MKKLFTLLLLSLVFLTASSQKCLADNGVKMRKEETGAVKSFKIIPNYNRKTKVYSAKAIGDVPEGVTVDFNSQDISSFILSKGNSSSITISGMPSTCTITGISAIVRANLRGGAGLITATEGDNQFASLAFHGGSMDEAHGIVNDYGIEVGDKKTSVNFTFPNGNYQVGGNDITLFAKNLEVVEKPEFTTTIYINEYTVYYTEPAATPVNVKVTMNGISPTMSLANKATGDAVDVGTPEGRNYNFQATKGTYVLTAYATDGTTNNGTIEINVTDEPEQSFMVFTNTAYATNTKGENVFWEADVDYTVEAEVNSREGVKQEITVGNSIIPGRKTFLALNGNSYYVTMTPSEEHQAEGYMTLYKAGTLTAGVNVAGIIPKGDDRTITIPADAELFLGIKFAHFTAFKEIKPTKTEVVGNNKLLTFHLAEYQVYNYRTWREGGLTQAGYFISKAGENVCPELIFTEEDYAAFGPKTIKHDVTWNGGYETGDIFVNINERGHLNMKVGDKYDAHAMRTWQLTDTQTNNYFMEPDFHYTVVDLDGNPSTGVIEISPRPNSEGGDCWSVINAVGKGTAIVLVTYDAIGTNYYDYSYKTQKVEKTPYMGGEYWGAIWPENTAAYVVTVGGDATTIKPNMHINEAYNTGALKVAGENVDAEHDVFYYLDTEPGAEYTFTPEGVASVEMAYPTIGAQMATYTGFGSEGVTKNDNGSYTLLLKEGRQIVRMKDAQGNAVYQVLTAKPCHREITNESRPGSNIFQPGDKVKIQYSGLRHPANKLSGIYNMSAYVTYNSVPNGTSLILGPGQYTFGSAPAAQAIMFEIAEDHDVAATPEIVMNEGVLQVNGYGDPIGNHRTISRLAGRSPNFTAVPHKTYFGFIPEVRIALSPLKKFVIRPVSDVPDVAYTITKNGKPVTDNGDGTFSGTYGNYVIIGAKAGYRCYRGKFTIADDAEGEQIVNVDMQKASTPDAWDGVTKTEPSSVDGVYQIATGAEMAWYGNDVNSGNRDTKAVLIADIDLADYEWRPMGGGVTSKAYKGVFDGQGHTISGIYVDNPTNSHQGFFGFVNNGTVKNLTIDGQVTGSQYIGALAAYLGYNTTIDRCVNKATVNATVSYAGGLVGYLSEGTSVITNCYNLGTVKSPLSAGGIAGANFLTAVVENVFSLGEIECNDKAGACVGGTSTKENFKNVFAVREYNITDAHTLVTEEQMKSGEVAYKLGEAFGQEIGKDEHPVIGGMKVFYSETTNTYYNELPNCIYELDCDLSGAKEIFDANGRRLPQAQRGLNIVRLQNGKVVKVTRR